MDSIFTVKAYKTNTYGVSRIKSDIGTVKEAQTLAKDWSKERPTDRVCVNHHTGPGAMYKQIGLWRDGINWETA